jgi:hypothetical protein
MNRITNYKGYSRWWLSAGMVLAILSPEYGAVMMVVAILCFVSAVTTHASHVGQQLDKEVLEVRKRLKRIEDRLGPDTETPSDQ